MGNAGGFSSVGHSTDAGDANTSEYDAGQQQHGHQEYGGNSKLSEKQLQQMAGNFGGEFQQNTHLDRPGPSRFCNHILWW